MARVYALVLVAASMCFAVRIGLLRGIPGSECEEELSIYLDTEDNNGQTRIVSGNTNLPGLEVSKSGIRFNYCGLNITDREFQQWHPVAFDYAFLKLDKDCPLGSFQFARHHDTEDHNNNNSYEGDVWPNVVNENATLYYCFVPASQNYIIVYPFVGYGVFTNADFAYSYREYGKEKPFNYHTTVTEIYIDDEDSGNNNYWNYFSFTDVERVQKIMNGTKNTTMYVAYWYLDGSGLEKSAVAEKKSEPVQKKVSLAPVIKGLDRSFVSVDLKSAGDVKITIANAKGAVIADVSEKNLQPGVHQVPWNSGVVPNGRYIVTVRQNGEVKAKNVILK